jgi:DNA invertase Pin-like site-specific DNA recombinase
MQKKIPIAIFVRVSKNSQDYNRQIKELTQLAKKFNYHVVAIICEKISGSKKNDQREGIKDLLTLAHQGKIKKVLTSEVSRIGRNVSETLKILDELTELKISVYAKNLSLETLTPEGKRSIPAGIIFTLMAELARGEKEQMIERIKSGLEYAKSKGVKLGRKTGTTMSEEQMRKKYSRVIQDLKKGLSIRKAARANNISVFTVQRVKALI